jgi:sigma-B regulation protein RsbU (phosphoserine phosphatase)
MRRLLLAFAAGLLAASACAQTFYFLKDRQPVASLDGKWRFHPGDSPEVELTGKRPWAQPGFDDSAWPLLESDRSWYDQGYPGLSGWAWYRFKVELPAGAGPFSLRLPEIQSAYEVYADGAKIGAFGHPWLHAFLVYPRPYTFDLPRGEDTHPQEMTIALRVWHDPTWAAYAPGGPGSGGALIGSSQLIAKTTFLSQAARDAQDSDVYFDALLRAIIGLVVLGLFLLRRGEREYLWFALIQLFGCAEDVLDFAHSAYCAVPIQLYDLLGTAIAAGFWLAGLYFVASVLRAQRGIWFRLSAIGIVLSLLPVPLYWPGWIPVPAAGLLSSFLVLPSQVWILVTLAARARRRDPDALLLVVPVLLVNGFFVFANLIIAAAQFGFLPALIDPFNVRFNTVPFPIGLYTLFNMAYSVALLAFLIRRLSLSRRKEELLEGQLEAARQVQQRLVPAQVPAIAGFSIAAAFQPASEVGGDFYQVIPQQDGSALVLVGDVSGKGLKAAMNGVLAIGALRTLAAEQLSPGPLLERLNTEMTGSQDGGFITCICAHITPDGLATLANAGHLSPYRNGEEVPVESGLPLGIVAGAQYAETRLKLEPGETLTMMSDGVVESRNAAGELFGFERTRAVSGRNAADIALAAEQFGQEDDITVLTLTLAPAEIAHA